MQEGLEQENSFHDASSRESVSIGSIPHESLLKTNDKLRTFQVVDMKPYDIAINAVSGGGKTALAQLVQQSLPDAVAFCFDDFDDTNMYPEDYYEWFTRGRDLEEFDCPGMRAAIEQAIREGTYKYIVLDYPFGRDHPRFKTQIDLSVFVDTPLDVAMARRILRDYPSSGERSDKESMDRLREEMTHYIEKARYPYLDTYRHREMSDLVLDGWKPLEEIRDRILEAIAGVESGPTS